MMMLLETIGDKEKFKAKHVVNLLLGVTSNAIKTYKHDVIDKFAAGNDKDESTGMPSARLSFPIPS